MHFPILERAMWNSQLASQFLHREILFQPLGPHMISKTGRIQVPIRTQPPTPRISTPIDQQPPLKKSQQTHPARKRMGGKNVTVRVTARSIPTSLLAIKKPPDTHHP